jgi:hypothetical protein
MPQLRGNEPILGLNSLYHGISPYVPFSLEMKLAWIGSCSLSRGSCQLYSMFQKAQPIPSCWFHGIRPNWANVLSIEELLELVKF